MGQKLKILHLEDNLSDAELIGSWLEENGLDCEIVRVDTRDEFVTMIEECSFDLVLADRTTPTFDGISALALAQQIRPDIPFIFVSGTLDEELAIRTLRSGATDYVLKHRLSRLLPAVQRAMGEVHKRRELEDAARSLQEQAELLDRANDMILIRDLEDRVTYWNRGAERCYGWTREQARDKNLHALLGTTFPRPLTDIRAELLQTDHWEGELEQFRADGARILVASRWTLRRDATGAPRSILEIGSDQTEHRRLEQQLVQAQKLESLGTLAGGIAHDFNNMLTIILGYASMLGTAQPRSKQIEDISTTIIEASERGAGLVRQLLTFARKQEAVLASVNLNVVVEEIMRMLRQTFPKTIAFETILAPNLGLIRADPTQIHQLLLNLCVNARDAMPHGGTLAITTGNVAGHDVQARFPSADGPEYISLRVSDTGSGMDAEIRQRVFEPFFTTKEAGKGTGLGLAVVYGVVESHHGHIHIDSEPGQGTTFTVFFPVSDVEAEVMLTEHGDADVRGHDELILVVEDEHLLRDLAKNVLTSNGYRVVTARDGLEAIDVFRRQATDISLVICNFWLPKLDGFQIFLRMQDLGSAPRFLMCSGYLEPARKAQLLAAGVQDFLPKPYRPRQILAAVHEVLEAPR